jgi:hypothetical protein
MLGKLAGRTPQVIPAALLPASGNRLVLSHGKDHGPDAIPADAVLVEAGKQPAVLMFPPGAIRISTRTKSLAIATTPLRTYRKTACGRLRTFSSVRSGPKGLRRQRQVVGPHR